MKRIYAAVGGILMLAVCLVGRMDGGEAGKAKPEVAVLFLGFTNNGAGELAQFCFTNPTSAHFVFAAPKVEKLESNVWTEIKVKNPFARAVRNRWSGMKEELHSGEGFIFTGSPPVTNAPWRLTFTCTERAVIKDAAGDLVSHLTNTNSAALRTRQFSGRRFIVSSPEMRPEKEASGVQ